LADSFTGQKGIIIADINGVIVYYNDTMGRIDDIDPKTVLAKKVTDIYDLTDNTSMVMECIKTGRSIINRVFFYRISTGKVVNTIHSVYPLLSWKRLTGAICFVKSYTMLGKTVASVAVARKKSNLGNDTRFTFADIVGAHPDLLRSVDTARMAANSPSPVP
jgi:arginine utilization regulatory protein